ncbi:MAG: right-handed parallel beta-helix repeat-containing protein [Candidatus Coatesbacteria bacterium]|nr:right-handed parallel beta-helix repeat-containing protein [Candidatus Coatesbacteria bacterium]
MKAAINSKRPRISRFVISALASAVLTAAILVLSAAADTNYYVNRDDGVDTSSRDGQSWANAWKSIGYAIDHTSQGPGDLAIINVSDGVYDRSIEGSSGFPLYPKEYQTIRHEGGGTLRISAQNSNRVLHYDSVRSDAKLEGIVIQYGGSSTTDRGGGIFMTNSALVIEDCQVEYCDVYATGSHSRRGAGGGIYCDRGSVLTMTDCKLLDNTSPRYGGGIFVDDHSECNLTNVEFDLNTTSFGGGIMLWDSSDGTFTDCVFTRNVGTNGGALRCNESSASLIHCYIGTDSGGTAELGNTSIHGGGLTFHENATGYVDNCLIKYNKCTRTSGGVNIAYKSQVKFMRTEISNNELYDHDLYYHGAGMRIVDGNTVDFINCKINNNTMAKDGAAMAILGENNSVRISTSELKGNEASYADAGATRGGAIYLVGNSELSIEKSDITDNISSSGHGGAFYIESAPIGSIKECLFDNNEAGRSGGAIRIYEATEDFEIEHCIFNQNQADTGRQAEYGGGALNVVEGNPSVLNCLIILNSVEVEGNGGGILCQAAGSPRLTNCTIADSVGYGVYADAGEECVPELLNCIVWDNSLGGIANVDCSNVSYSDIQGGDCCGQNDNICDPPLFETGSGDYGNYCLSQTDSGQSEQSPCVDTGQGNASDHGLHTYSTRTSGAYDDNAMDMGYHYESSLHYFYVDATIGDNSSYDGRSPTITGDSGPWKTITWALDTENLGISNENHPITIFVAAGDYDIDMGGGDHETFPLKPETQYISLIGAGCDITTINAYEEGTDHTAIVVEKNPDTELKRDHFTIKGFKITGADNTPPGLGNGGAIRVTESDYLTLDGCDIDNNLAKSGGGIYFRDSLGNEIRSCLVRNNTAESGSDGYGGGVCISDGSYFFAEFSSFTGNSASMGGGGVALRNHTEDDPQCRTEINGSVFMANEAVNGAGVFAYLNSVATVFNTSLTGNAALGDGGAVYCEDNCNLALTYAHMTGNEAAYHGGAVACVDYCEPRLNFCWVADNSAGLSGGGLYYKDHCNQTSEEGKVLNTVIANNVVTGGEGNGAAIYCEIASSPWIWFCTIADNTPTGVHAVLNSYPKLDHSILWNNGDDVDGIDCGEDHICYCDIEDGDCNGQNGNISANPLFVPRDREDPDNKWTGYYIAQYPAQSCQSPCFDAGADTAESYRQNAWTTCTDGARDEGMADLGCHFRDSYEGSDDTYIELVSFEAKANRQAIKVTWETATEIDNAGFNLYRVESGERSTARKLNDRMIPAKGSTAEGAKYEFIDSDIRPGTTYEYYLIDIATDGRMSVHGPVEAEFTVLPMDPIRRDVLPNRGLLSIMRSRILSVLPII